MLPHFNLVVEPEYVEAFDDALRTVSVGGEPLLFRRSDDDFFSLQFGHTNVHDRVDAVTIAGEARPIASLGLETVEIEDRSGTTAYHVPEGILAVYDPARLPAVDGLTSRGLRPRGGAGTPPDPGRRAADLHGTAGHPRRPAARLTHPACRTGESSKGAHATVQVHPVNSPRLTHPSCSRRACRACRRSSRARTWPEGVLT